MYVSVCMLYAYVHVYKYINHMDRLVIAHSYIDIRISVCVMYCHNIITLAHMAIIV